MPTAAWTNDALPGGTWFAGQDLILAGMDIFDGLAVLAGQLGQVSEWTPDPI